MTDAPAQPARIALGGPMAVGKSSVGRRLAVQIGARFVDLDAQIGDVPGWFARGGEAAFRDRESAVLAAVAQGVGVMALGGGALVRAENRVALADWRVVILMATPDTLASRMETTSRPLAGRWRDLLEARRPVWAAYGEPVWTDGLDVDEVAEQVRRRCGLSASI